MLKSYKTEINPTNEQRQIINRTIGVCRYVYNFYLAHNKEVYETEKRFVSGMDFSKWLNNEFIPNNSEFQWIKEVSSKSVRQSIMNAEKAFKNFFKGKSRYPKFKKKGKSDVKMYFVKTDAKTVIHCERHRIKIPSVLCFFISISYYFLLLCSFLKEFLRFVVICILTSLKKFMSISPIS